MHVAVAIVGAGISGLTLAYLLHKEGIDVLVFEQNNKPGGKIHSLFDGEYVFEKGAHTILVTSPHVHSLLSELNLRNDVITAHPHGKKRYIVRDGKLSEAPTDFFSLLRTDLISFRAKMLLLREPFVNRGSGTETVAEFTTRRFNKEWLQYIFDPLVVSLCAGSSQIVSMKELLPTFVHYEQKYGSIIRGILVNKLIHRSKIKYSLPKYSFTKGLSTLPNALAQRLGSRVVYNSKVISIQQTVKNNENVFSIATTSNVYKTLTASNVVLATPAPCAFHILEKLNPSFAKILQSIQHPPLFVLNCVFRKNDIGIPFNGFGFIVPSAEKNSLLGCIWNSCLYPHHAPLGNVLFSLFIGGTRIPELGYMDEQILLEKALYDVKNFMHISGNPVHVHYTRWEQSLPQYERGHSKNMEIFLSSTKRFPGLYCIGNYISGISIDHCINNAFTLAKTITNKVHGIST